MMCQSSFVGVQNNHQIRNDFLEVAELLANVSHSHISPQLQALSDSILPLDFMPLCYCVRRSVALAVVEQFGGGFHAECPENVSKPAPGVTVNKCAVAGVF